MSTYLPTLEARYSPKRIREYYDAGVWLPESFYDQAVRQAEARGDKVYVFDSDTSLTFAEFRLEVLRLAVGLKRRGVNKGDRVLAQMPNWTEFPVIAAAASRIGAVIVPVMPIYRAHDVSYVASDSGAKVAFFAQKFRNFDYLEMFTELQADAPALRDLVAVRPESGTDLGSVLDFSSLLAEGSIEDLEKEAGPDSSPDDPFEIVYTSGTTSRPKGCLHTLNTARSSAVQMVQAFGYTDADVQFGPSPITHSTGLVTSVLIPLHVGMSSHFIEVWEPNDALRRIQDYGVTAAVTATAFLQMLMAAFDPGKHDASSLRLWVCAGAPIPGSVVEKASSMFPGCRVQSLYGRSENLATTLCPISDRPERSVSSDGRAWPPSVVEVVDAQGNEAPVGEEGDIAYLGPSHMLGYWHNEAATLELFTPSGFSRSGDLGIMDADGYVRVTGRLKDIIIRGGMNISARELEDHLIEHPEVSNVGVVAMPDERLGEKVCAYVVAVRPDVTLSVATIAAYLRERGIPNQKLPERVEMVSELPTTATGKIQKHTLRADIARKLGGVVAEA